MDLGLSSWAHAVMRVLHSDRRGSESEKTCDGRGGSRGEESREPLGGQKDPEVLSPLEPGEGTQPCWPLYLSPEKLILDL